MCPILGNAKEWSWTSLEFAGFAWQRTFSARVMGVCAVAATRTSAGKRSTWALIGFAVSMVEVASTSTGLEKSDHPVPL